MQEAASLADGSSREFLEAALETVPTPILLIEPGTGRVIFANRAADRLAGGDFPKGAEAERYHELYYCTDAAGKRIPNEEMPGVRAARGERLERFQMDWHLLAGTRTLQIASDVVRDSSGEPVVVLTFEDVTTLKDAERVKEELLVAERHARERAERAERRSTFLGHVGELLAGSLDYEETLRRVARAAVPDKADWCAVDMLGPHGRVDRLAVTHVDPAKERYGWELHERYPPDVEGDRGLPEVLRTGEPQLYEEISDELLALAARDAGHLAVLRELGMSSVMLCPLTVRGAVVGVMTFITAESGRRYSDPDLALGMEVARRASVAIENAQLYRERSDIAQTLQRSLLPPRLPEIPGFEVAAHYRAAGEGYEVGGDFYDAFRTPRGAWSILVGDVCGKGPRAAALTALARYTMRAAVIVRREPSKVLQMTNEAILREQTEGHFVSVVHACLSGEDNETLTIANAGHPPALLVRADGSVESVKGAGALLGIDRDCAYEDVSATLAPGDALVLHTDGVLDAGAPARALDTEWLMGTLEGKAGRSASELAELLERAALDAADGAPRDDIAILVARRRPS